MVWMTASGNRYDIETGVLVWADPGGWEQGCANAIGGTHPTFLRPFLARAHEWRDRRALGCDLSTSLLSFALYAACLLCVLFKMSKTEDVAVPVPGIERPTSQQRQSRCWWGKYLALMGLAYVGVYTVVRCTNAAEPHYPR